MSVANQTQLANGSLEALFDGPAAALLDSLMCSLPIGLTIARVPDVTIMRVSDAGAQLLQRSTDQLENISVDAHPDAYRVSDPRTGEMADASRLPLTRATIAGETVRGEEWLITAEDGRKVPILCNAGPIRNEAGSIVGGLIAWADLTRQKELEASLSEALQARDLLMLELHHRVRNHLNIVASIIRSESEGCSPEAQELVDRLSQRLTALSNSYGALQADKVESTSARELIEHICRPLISEAVELRIEVDDDLEVSTTGVPLLGIIVNEAVCNALKHAFPDNQHGVIDVSLVRSGETYRLVVSDNGVGLGAAVPRAGGTALARRLANIMGGSVELRQNDGPGASMIVRMTRM